MLALCTLLAVPCAIAETVYVTDILQLGLHRAQDTSDTPFRNLVSGTELEVLRRIPNFAEVRTPDGEQGWVKSTFLVPEKPAQLIVAEMDAELQSLRRELAASEEGRLRAEQEAARIVADTAELMGTADSVRSTLASLRAENSAYAARVDAFRSSLPLRWALAALGVAFLSGLLVGVWGLDLYIRRRHGGFRVY
jgi:SH3 domain protein